MTFNPVANNDVFTILSNAQLVTLNIGANDSDPDGNITAFDLDIATFKQDTSVSLPSVSYGSVAWADYNGDSKSDFLLTGMDDNDTSISRLYVNTGSGFSLDRSISLPDIRYGSVAWADYNGDSKPDFLLTGLDNNDTSISWLYVNTGSGFNLDRSISLPGVQNSSVAWADYNGDSKPDFLLTGLDNNNTSISQLYVNTGSGFSLDTSVSLPGVQNSSVAWADYNGDGKPDLLFTGLDKNYTEISRLYVNTGSGFNLDTLVSLPGVRYGSVAWADYNGDSKPDFLLTGQDKNFTPISRLYRNTGSGFNLDTSVSLSGVGNSSVAWTDYNGDSKPDFLLTGFGSNNKISQLYVNTSHVLETNITTSQGSFNVDENGQLLFTPISGLTDETTLSYIVLDDEGNESLGNINIIINKVPVANDDSITTNINKPVVVNLSANDSDPDGQITAFDLDPTTTNIEKKRVTNQGTFSVDDRGNLKFTPARKFTGIMTTLQYQVFDNIGESDTGNITINLRPIANDDQTITVINQAVTINLGENDSDPDGQITAFDLEPTIFQQNVRESFERDTSVLLPGVSYGSVAWADYNGDSKPDFLLSGLASGSNGETKEITQLYKNTGSGFTLDKSVSLPGIRAGAVAWQDYNGDGKPDLLLTGTGVSKLYKNTGSGFSLDKSVALPGLSVSAGAWADYNGDSKPDFILTGNTVNSYYETELITQLYKNTGSGFSLDKSVALPGQYFGTATWADYDQDGKPDLLLVGMKSIPNITDEYNITSELYINTGSGFDEDTSFSKAVIGVRGSSSTVAWADYNNDSKPDLLILGDARLNFENTPVTALYLNTDSGMILDQEVLPLLPRLMYGAVAWQDYNGDDKPDFIITGTPDLNSGISQLYINTGNTFTLDTSVSLPGVQNSSVAWQDYNGDGKPDFIITGTGDYPPYDISYLYLNKMNPIDTSKTTSQGTFTVDASGQLIFTPVSGFTGTATLPYQIFDELGFGQTANISIIVTDLTLPNQNPVADNDKATTTIGQAVSINIKAGDSDVDGSITGFDLDLRTAGVQNRLVKNQGTFSVDRKGQLVFTPNTNFTGTASLQYQAIDDLGATSNKATVSINVTNPTVPNENPTAGNDTGATNINQAVSINIKAGDSDVDGSITGFDLDLTNTGVQNTLVNNQGTFSVDRKGQLVFTPNTTFTGTASLQYQAIDNLGATSNNADVSINVEAIEITEPEQPPTTGDVDNTDDQFDDPTTDPNQPNQPNQPDDNTDVNIPDNENFLVNQIPADRLPLPDVDNPLSYQVFLGRNQPDVLTNANTTNDLILTFRGNDTINGGAGNDLIYAGKDDDLVTGDSGDDIIYGDNGDDTIAGNDGNDWLNGNWHEDIVSGDAGNDTVDGGKRDDTVDGSLGDDTIYGGEGNDLILGGEGNDLLITDQGHDTLTGGLGNDLFALTDEPGINLITDFTTGQDKFLLTSNISFSQLTFTNITGGTSINLGDRSLAVITGINAEEITVNDFQSTI